MTLKKWKCREEDRRTIWAFCEPKISTKEDVIVKQEGKQMEITTKNLNKLQELNLQIRESKGIRVGHTPNEAKYTHRIGVLKKANKSQNEVLKLILSGLSFELPPPSGGAIFLRLWEPDPDCPGRKCSYLFHGCGPGLNSLNWTLKHGEDFVVPQLDMHI